MGRAYQSHFQGLYLRLEDWTHRQYQTIGKQLPTYTT